MSNQATPRPWRIEGNEIVSNESFHAHGHLRNKEGFSNASYSFRICEMNGNMGKPMDDLDPVVPMANAKLIVKAVNNFDSMLAALNAVAQSPRGHLSAEVVIKIMEAIENAQGGAL